MFLRINFSTSFVTQKNLIEPLFKDDKNWEKFVSKLGFQPQISAFTHRRLNKLDYWDTYTDSETNLSLIHISIQDSQNVILYYNSYQRATHKWVFCLDLLYILTKLNSLKDWSWCKQWHVVLITCDWLNNKHTQSWYM